MIPNGVSTRMNNDLQAILARRRRLADGARLQEEEESIAAIPSPPKPASKEGNLQEIMARRRRLAEGEPEELGIEDLPARTVGGRNNSFQGSGNLQNSQVDLQAIMERRRRIADGEDVPPPPSSPSGGSSSPSSFPISPMASLQSRRTYAPRAFSSPPRSSSGLAVGERPSAIASPVKQGLKSVPMSSDLAAAMERRKKAAEGGPAEDGSPAAEQQQAPPPPPPPRVTGTFSAESAASRSNDSKEDNEIPRNSRRLTKPKPGLGTKNSRDELDKSSSHSKRGETGLSRHEKEPLLDIDDSDDPSSDDDDDDIEVKVPAQGQKKSAPTKSGGLASSQHSKRNLGASGHSKGGLDSSQHRKPGQVSSQNSKQNLGSSSHSSKRGGDLDKSSSHSKRGGDMGKRSSHGNRGVAQSTKQRSSLLDSDGSDDSSDDDDPPMVDRTVSKKKAPLKVSTKELSLFDDDDDDDSSSDEERRRPSQPLDSPAAAVMGVSTAETDDAGVDEESDEVERFAAALEKEEPAEANDAADERAGRRLTTQTNSSESKDEVMELPGKKQKGKQGRNRMSESSLASHESENSQDKSVDSGGSGEGPTEAPGSGRRPRNRRSSTSGDGVAVGKKPSGAGAGAGANRRRSTYAVSSTEATASEERRRKVTRRPVESRRASGVERTRSGESRSSAEFRPEGKNRTRQRDGGESDNLTSDGGGGMGSSVHEPAEESGVGKADAIAKEDERATGTSNAFDAGAWGGFGAFGETATDSSALPATSEHSAFPALDQSAFLSSGTDKMIASDSVTPSGGDGFPASGDAFSSGFMADFGDAAAFNGAAKNEEKVDFSTNAFGKGFDDAVGAFDGTAAFASSGADAFEQPEFSPAPAKEEVVYDTSPLAGVPTKMQPMPALYQKTVVKGPFQGSLATNPLNGNVILCSDSGNGLVLREVDSRRQYLQVAVAPVMSPELQRKVMAKFSFTIHGVESVIRLSAGLHSEQGQTRLRVGAILDLRVLETAQPLRLVAIWQWGNGAGHPITIQYALSPPSGSDFSYDAATLAMADGLIFLAGTSPKGPCVFVSKPAVRESWTANSLPGNGEVSAMEVTPSLERTQPYLAVGLTDKSISIWTYREAVEGASTKAKEAGPKRLLYPMCRLESSKALSGIDATSFNPSGSSTGQGKCTYRWPFRPLEAHSHCHKRIRLKVKRTLYTLRLATTAPFFVVS